MHFFLTVAMQQFLCLKKKQKNKKTFHLNLHLSCISTKITDPCLKPIWTENEESLQQKHITNAKVVHRNHAKTRQ